jgi:hypothetical protein
MRVIATYRSTKPAFMPPFKLIEHLGSHYCFKGEIPIKRLVLGKRNELLHTCDINWKNVNKLS